MTSAPKNLLTGCRVLYIMTALEESGGGHFYSMKSTAEAVMQSTTAQVAILQIGVVKVNVFRDATVPIFTVLLEGVKFQKYFHEILAASDKFAPTHVHAFDNRSYYFARILARIYRAKAFLTRPGGPNPAGYFPYFDDLFVYSRESLDFFKNRYPLRRIHLLPQRIAPVAPDNNRANRLVSKYGMTSRILLRVCRIGPYYQRILLQTLNLARMLRQRGASVQAVILGYVENEETLRLLKANADPADRIITDPEFTHNASALVHIAEWVVGTGRSLMEAASAGCIVLTPVRGVDIPIMVDDDNYEALAVTNFSERNRLRNIDASHEFEKILATFADPNKKSAARNFVVNRLSKKFDINHAVPRICQVYNLEQKKQPSWRNKIDLSLNLAIVLRWYVPAIIQCR